MRKSYGLFLFLLFVFNSSGKAEGTRSVWPVFTGNTINDQSGGLLLNFLADPSNGSYPVYTYGSDSLARLHVNVKDFTQEDIRFGFSVRRVWFTACNSLPGNINGDYTNAVTGGRRVFWRLKDPNGNIVATSGGGGIPFWNGGASPSTVPGFIGSHAEAINGPDNLNGVGTAGYTPFIHNPSMNGDYYFEFNFNDLNAAFDNTGCSWAAVAFQYFDVSIASGTETIPGRLWSRHWSLSTVNRAPNAGLGALSENTSKFHVYTSDSIVSRIDLEDIVPGYFNVFANENGVGTSGNFEQDAKSTPSPPFALNRKNKIFLNTPDSTIFPARGLTRSVSPAFIQKCSDTVQCIIVDLNRASSATVFLEINGIPGFQESSSDRLISAPNLNKGVNCIPWDGTDGLGNPLTNGDTIFIQLLFLSNVTQVPLQDIESNPQGIRITLEKPITGSTAVFWDDSDVGGGTELSGCISTPTTGCHDWVGDFTSGLGNGNVINSYWFSTLDTLIPIPIVDSTFTIDIIKENEDVSCNPSQQFDPGPIDLTSFNGDSLKNFRWLSSGSGTFLPHDSTLFASYLPSAEDIEFGGIVTIYLRPIVGCESVIDSVKLDFGNRPGGVNTGLIAWYKANDGARDAGNNPVTNGQNVERWRNKAFLGNDATAVVNGPIFSDQVFNGNPALIFTNNPADRLTLPVDFGAVISGNGIYDPANSTGIINGTNANGSPDGTFAEIHDPGDLMVLDLGTVIPAGIDYVITWRRKSTYGNTAVADMVVEESINPGSGYSTNPFTPQTSDKVNFINSVLTTQIPTRYIRISELTGMNDDIDFDAVSFTFDSRKDETVFLVASRFDASTNSYYNDGSTDNLRALFSDGANNPRFRYSGSSSTVDVASPIPTNEAFISVHQINQSANERFWLNGNLEFDSEFGPIPTSTNMLLGNNAGNTAELSGAIAEFIVFNQSLSENEVQQIESYLAIKYGLSLNRNYRNIDGSTLFTADGSGPEVFDNDIAGIGNSECKMELNQNQSISSNADALVQMNSDSLSPGDFLLWANDDAPLTANRFSVNELFFTERIDRSWKAQATGTPGETTLAFFLGDLPVTSNNPNDYGLITSNDPDLSDGVLNGFPKRISNDTLYIDEVIFSGISYFTLATEVIDTDDDGVPDEIDLDNDNDGIPDLDECALLPANFNISGGDGGSTTNFNYNGQFVAQFDFDFVDNQLDIQINGNGLHPDAFDFQGGGGAGFVDLQIASDNAMITTPWVANSNGLPRVRVLVDLLGNVQVFASRTTTSTELELMETANGTSFNTVSILEGVNSFSVINPDGPGPDAISGTAFITGECDQDRDGVSNRFDLDSDNDGIADIIEAGGADTDGDGIVDGMTDLDRNGFADSLDPNLGETPLTDADTDGDGLPNRLDLDSDNDGLTDNVEAQTTAAFVAPSGNDTDGDGWDNQYDADNGGTAITLSDNDVDGTPDYIDSDSDGDGLFDWTEGFDDNASGDALDDFIDRADTFETAAGNPLFYVNTDDADADGIPDWLEDDDLDNAPNFLDPDNALYQDTDNDGLIDLYDTDNFGLPSNLPDLDSDGNPDFRDTDNQISLPITLVFFEAEKAGDKVQLTWQTASEINNDYFTIERSSDARNFSPLFTHPGAGNSNEIRNYLRFDENPMPGNNYYRLRQTDFDGKTEVFEIKVVNFNFALSKKVEIYPNPVVDDLLNLKFSNWEQGSYQLKISDVRGNLINEITIFLDAEESVHIKTIKGLSEISKGEYFITILGEGNFKTLKFILH